MRFYAEFSPDLLPNTSKARNWSLTECHLGSKEGLVSTYLHRPIRARSFQALQRYARALRLSCFLLSIAKSVRYLTEIQAPIFNFSSPDSEQSWPTVSGRDRSRRCA